MGKSTSDTIRDLLGGITDDLKEAFDDIIDYDERDRGRGRRRGRGRGRGRGRDGHWRQQEDDGRWYDRDDDRWRRREDDDRWYDRDDGHWRRRGQEGDRRPDGDAGYDSGHRSPRPTADLPRQSRQGEEAGQEDLGESVRALRSELAYFVRALRETSDADRSTSD